MRPLRLVVDGFACFREKQELDFASLDLFAIWGSTGAGKSSLLDAMIFALYGKVPRVGKEYSECISLGRDRLSVVFDFRLAGHSFRITRVGRRRGAGSAQLEKLVEGSDETTPLGDQVREVDRMVEDLLGLGYDAFTQAVILPQNEFAEFLQSKPSDRQRILSSLLRLDVYERMKKRAGELASKSRTAIENYVRRLDEDYAGATAQAVDELAQQHKEVADQNQIRRQTLETTQSELETTKLLRDKTKELSEHQEALKRLRTVEPAVRATENRLAAARRAGPIIPILDAAVAAEAQVSETEARIKMHRTVLAAATKNAEQAAVRLESAQREAEAIPALDRRIRALDELKGEIRSREIAEERLSAAHAEAKRLTLEHDARQKETSAAAKELAAHEKVVTRLEAGVGAIGFDATRARKLDAWRDRAAQLAELRAVAAKAMQSASVADERAAKERIEADAASTRLQTVEGQHQAAAAAFEATEKELQASETEHAASHLRADLKIGDACPVCLQEVAALPQKGRTPRLEGLRARHVAAKQKLDDVETKLRDCGRSASRLTASAEKAAERAQELRTEAEGATKEVARLETKLEESIGKLVSSKRNVPIEARVVDAVAAENSLRERYEAAVADRDDALKKRTALERAKEKLEGAAAGLAEKLASANSRIQEQREEIERVAGEVRKVTKRQDPLVEREELAAKCKDLEERVSALEGDVANLKQALRDEETKAREMARQQTELQTTAAKKRKEANTAVKDAEFVSDQAARDAQVASAEQRRMEKEVDAHKRDLHATQKRIGELEVALDGKLVTEAQYSQAVQAAQLLRREHDEGIGLEARLKQQHVELTRKAIAAEQLGKQLERERVECRHYDQLATDLRSDRFQEFILREAFSELVARASQRLFKLSGRYTLDMKDGEFDVLDRDNAGERRSARTLSGGETFLASLALALELSEQVQRAAGAVPLDSLFIDEGFGSLDAESLDVATDAVQSLPQGGRMVGIITHIPELRDRLDARVVVEKRTEGSRIHVEVG